MRDSTSQNALAGAIIAYRRISDDIKDSLAMLGALEQAGKDADTGVTASLFLASPNLLLASWATGGSAIVSTLGRQILARQVMARQVSQKIAGQMVKRGWTNQMVRRAITRGREIPEMNFGNGNPASRFVDPQSGLSVVIDRVTKEIIHVGAQGFRYGIK